MPTKKKTMISKSVLSAGNNLSACIAASNWEREQPIHLKMKIVRSHEQHMPMCRLTHPIKAGVSSSLFF